MKNFEEHFGTYARSDLGTTFRCEKKITDQATHFILQNDFQIPKKFVRLMKASTRLFTSACEKKMPKTN